MSIGTITIDLGAGGGYMGVDVQAKEEFSRICDNFTKMKNILEGGGLPSLMAKITGPYSSGHPWSEVFEEDTGTWTVLTTGRQSGVDIWPKAFEQNGGTADLTNMIVELDVSQDQDNGNTTVSFDGKSPRLAANDIAVLQSNPSFDAGTRVLTINYKVLEFDIKGRSTGSTAATRTVTIPGGGGFDAYQEASLVEASVSKISIPTDEGSSTILEFVDDASAGQIKLRLKTSTQYKVIIGGASDWEIGYVKFH